MRKLAEVIKKFEELSASYFTNIDRNSLKLVNKAFRKRWVRYLKDSGWTERDWLNAIETNLKN